MKKNVIYLIAVTTLFFSCGEDFLEPVRNTNVLTDVSITENAEANPALIEGNLTGIAGLMSSPFATLGEDFSRHNDLGHKGTHIWTDIVSGDMALSASSFGWYNGAGNLLFTQDFTHIDNRVVWNFYFRVIGIANSVIQTSGGNNPGAEIDDNTRRINAQAKAYRGFAYFYLAQLFQDSYDPNQPILPLYAIDEVISAKVEASVIYDLIVSDLLDAIAVLEGYNRVEISEIDQSVARGLLAYTYAAMGNYADAKVQADAVIASGYPLTTADELVYTGTSTPTGGFNSVNTPSWMWGFDITADLDHQLVNWWGQIDTFTYSYAGAGDSKSIDDLLYSQIPENDIRKEQFQTAFSDLMPLNKFYAPGRTPNGQLNITTDYIYMRVEEFYLLSAEAAARTGNEAAAKNRLQDLLTIRLGSSAAATSYLAQFSGTALIDEIYFQTRVEMWGEGKTYFAMKRNQATVTRGTNHLFRAGESFQYNSDIMSFEIPETEIINNPEISTQN